MCEKHLGFWIKFPHTSVRSGLHGCFWSPWEAPIQLPASSGIEQIINTCQLPPLLISPHFSIPLPFQPQPTHKTSSHKPNYKNQKVDFPQKWLDTFCPRCCSKKPPCPMVGIPNYVFFNTKMDCQFLFSTLKISLQFQIQAVIQRQTLIKSQN